MSIAVKSNLMSALQAADMIPEVGFIHSISDPLSSS
jgi:hypothetical protein